MPRAEPAVPHTRQQPKISAFFKKAGTPEHAPEVPLTTLDSESHGLFSMARVHKSWLPCLTKEFAKPYFQRLKAFLRSELEAKNKVFPQPAKVFTWANLCPVSQIKVVILGQDPYHDDGQAHGLAFSVKRGVRTPPSLLNIYKELETDLGLARPAHGCLEDWAKRGVLLLNTSLTVRAHQAASHSGKGWEPFTDAVIEYVSQHTTGIVFLLWGGHAQKRSPRISRTRGHLILEAAHPSPLSAHRGFFGCRHFSKANAFLLENGHEPIDWSLPPLC